MDVFFYVVPLIMAAVFVLGAYRALDRSRQISRAWNGGLAAEGRCLRSFADARSSGDRTVLRHVYEFTARDGRTFRFEEERGPATTVEGDIVVVHYAPDRPEQATARPPARGRLVTETGLVLAFYGVGVAFSVGFMITVHSMLSMEFPMP